METRSEIREQIQSRTETNLNDHKAFSLSEGGLFERALAKMNLQYNQAWLVMIALGIAWLPLVIISAIEGKLYSGAHLPFLKDYAMQVRVLIALPLLIMIKYSIDSKVSLVIQHISESLMSEVERERFASTALTRAKKLAASGYTEIILLLLVVIATVSFVKGNVLAGLKSGTDSWMTTRKSGNESLSLAGYWSVIISTPLTQFFFIRWVWRYFVWMLLLFRISKSNLNLLPTHSDRSGGIGIIMLAQKSFNLFFVAGSVLVAGQLIVVLLNDPDSFNTIRGLGIAYMVCSILLLLLPLMFFAGKLFRIKNEGLMHLSKLGTTMSYNFEAEWINELPIEQRIEKKQVDPSMLYDYTGLYDGLQQLRTVPVTVRDIISMAAMFFIPFIPVLFIHYSVPELLQKIVGLLV